MRAATGSHGMAGILPRQGALPSGGGGAVAAYAAPAGRADCRLICGQVRLGPLRVAR